MPYSIVLKSRNSGWRTVSNGPNFFLLRFMTQAPSEGAIYRRGKNEDP